MKATLDTALTALDDALRRSVEEQAERVGARADADAGARVRQARDEADALVTRARKEGDAVAATMLAQESAALRRDAAKIVLDARTEVLEEVRAAVHRAVLGLRTAPDYPELLDGLAARAIARLGPGAKIVRDPDPCGGIIAEVSGRRIDYTLPVLADLTLAELGTSLEDLLR